MRVIHMPMVSFEQLQKKEATICVVGLGYVGLPLAVLLSGHFSVIGFDIDEKKISNLKKGIDKTGEVKNEDLTSAHVEFTTDTTMLATCQYIIVAVPTPIDIYNVPDMTLLKRASEIVGAHLSEGSIVVYESTVYPGATEEVCVPILEQASGLLFNKEFWVGYSPERVNPGDKEHTIDKIAKVVSASDDRARDVVSHVYGSITRSIHQAPSIRVAEAAKVIENTQRDLNIALMNELAILFYKMGISMYDVLDAAKTKWNFLPFTPGLVGGHCIGVDPYYLTYKAQAVGHRPEVILAGRGINDSMHKFIAHQIVKQMVMMSKNIRESHFVIFGITFKENIPDVRNSKVALFVKELEAFGVAPVVYDPYADKDDVYHEYGITLVNKEDLPKADTLIVAVAHKEFRQMTPQDLRAHMNHERLLLVDIKHMYDRNKVEAMGVTYWSL